MTIEELTKQLKDHLDEARSVQSLADEEKRAKTGEESKAIGEHLKAVKVIEGEIEQRRDLEETEQRFVKTMAEPVPRKSEPDPPDNRPDPDVDEAETRNAVSASVTNPYRGNNGFRQFGEFAQSVVRACSRTGQVDPRLEMRTTTSTFGNELAGADGGFAVPPDFASEIRALIFDEEGLLARTDQMQSATNSKTVPLDDDSPWSTSGISASWEGEGDQGSESKPLLKEATVRLNKLMVLVKMTDELLEDASAMSSYVPRKASSKINHKIDLAILQGSGAGQPSGILSSAATIAIAKESSQTADTIEWANVRKMWNRLYAPSRPNAIWIANQDTEGELQQMYFIDRESTALSTSPIYLPAGNNVANPGQSTLYGVPVRFHQACETLGDLGDIFLVDLSQYLSITKGGGIRSALSFHLHFDQDISTFKFTIRIGGLPWWPGTVSARDGSTTYSPFITLAERAT